MQRLLAGFVQINTSNSLLCYTLACKNIESTDRTGKKHHA